MQNTAVLDCVALAMKNQPLSVWYLRYFWPEILLNKTCCYSQQHMFEENGCNMKNSIDSIHPSFVDLSKPTITSLEIVGLQMSFYKAMVSPNLRRWWEHFHNLGGPLAKLDLKNLPVFTDKPPIFALPKMTQKPPLLSWATEQHHSSHDSLAGWFVKTSQMAFIWLKKHGFFSGHTLYIVSSLGSCHDIHSFAGDNVNSIFSSEWK